MHKLDEDLIRVNKLLVDCLESQLKEAEEKIKNLEWNVANWERKESLQASCCWENEKAAKEAEKKLKITTRSNIDLCGTIDELEAKLQVAREALESIAAPVRNDGTYNRCREACEQLARQALEKLNTR